ncbi:MAG: hypothetical protein IPL74_17640 [Bacteroidetes bacterium]|nr:hypothetical protein [Bacteroidota bacterium]
MTVKFRLDLSDWVIHFVHDKTNDQRPKWILDSCAYAFGEDGEEEVDEHLLASEREAENMNFDFKESDSLTAFETLKLILSMGYIRAGFSYRKEKKTIYGNRPAICFTEMPLHALIQYSKNRSYSGYTSSYAIAFPRDELFKYGARNVMYGLTNGHVEASSTDPFFDKWHRNLAQCCGIALHEQYRYVFTKIGDYKSIDWTHEREWRLACDYDCNPKVGLNFLLEEEESNPIKIFSQIVVIVNTNKEVNELINHLAQYYHGDIFMYSPEIVEKIKIVSLEHLSSISDDDLTKISIEDIDYSDFKSYTKVKSTKKIQEKVKLFIKEAFEYADIEHNKEWNNWSNKGLRLASNDDYYDLCAFVHVVLDEPTKIYSNALIDIGYAEPNGNWGIILKEIKSPPTQSRTIKKFYCQNIIKKLSELTGENFSIHEQLD